MKDKYEGQFTAEDEAIAVQLAAMAAVAMENWDLYQMVQAANRAKDEFLANVSHEIRTPMNAIVGMTELTLATFLSDDQRQCLETVQAAADSLLGMINDLLDFSKMEADKLQLESAAFSLRRALAGTLRTLAHAAHPKGLELVWYAQPEVPDALVGDAGRLGQVLLNLVGNAIKFTDNGEVMVHVSLAGWESSQPGNDDGGASIVLLFAVMDTGIGIPLDQQEKIFRAFEQLDTSTTRKYGGSGLGLTITARLVALMGGTIGVQSEPGQGSTFSFTARFSRQQHPAPRAAARLPEVFHDLPVLIVDDNATSRRVLQNWLRGWLLKPVGVANGAAAVDALRHGAADGRPYALMLLDARMPDMDGLELAAKIREQSELAATRIILLTSGDRPSDPSRSRELRIDAHLLKPVPEEELLETICRVMTHAEGAPPVPQPTEEPATAVAPLRILVAEDNEFNRRHLNRLLVRGGHDVQLASNGREALTLLGVKEQESGDSSEDSPALVFDLLLLDIHMPQFDGFEVIQALRARERRMGGRLPVIALTARAATEDRARCLAAGMDDYLSKPIRSADLFAAMDRVVSTRTFRPERPDPKDRMDLLDPVTLLAACGCDALGLQELCADYHAYGPARLTEVMEALGQDDAPRLREAAHKLSGLLSAFSGVAGALASELEDHAARSELDKARLLVGRLGTVVQELMQPVGGLSLETLRRQAAAAAGPNRTA